MSAITLKGNGRFGGLNGDAEFVGSWESVDSWSKYKITLWNTSAIEVIVEQSPDGTNIDKRSTHQIVAITADPETDITYQSNILRGQIRHPFLRVLVKNPTAVKIDECRVWVQAYQNGHLDAVEDRVGIHAIEKVSGEMTPINLVVDENGKNRLCVDAEVSIEDIKLTAQTDSITIFGTNDGTPTALAVDANGNLAVDVKVEGITLTPQTDGISIYGTNEGIPTAIAVDALGNLAVDVKIEGITLTPQTDGISIYGTDGTSPVALKTSVVAGEEGSVLIANSKLNSIEYNMNASPSIKFAAANITSSAGGAVSSAIDLGVGQYRDRIIVFYGELDVSTAPYTDPKLIMKFGEDNQGDFFGDGGYASYYKKPADEEGVIKWEFCFQRSACPLRYVQLFTETDAKLISLKCFTSKN